MDIFKVISDFALWLKQAVEQVVQFFLYLIMAFFDWLWEGFLRLLDSLGVAEAVNRTSSMFALIPDTVWYFANMAQIQYGISIVLGSFAIRFLIRRIPFFG